MPKTKKKSKRMGREEHIPASFILTHTKAEVRRERKRKADLAKAKAKR